MKPSFVDA